VKNDLLYHTWYFIWHLNLLLLRAGDQVEPWDVIDMLNQLYSVMDFLATHFKLYKVETIGDAYMCCSGLLESDDYHAERVANFALAVVECIKHVKSPVDGLPLNVRVGIHTGHCTSGVVGTLTPHYCLFGDMINTTARHETTGFPGKIHCSSVLYGRLKHFSMFDKTQYNFTPRGLVDMKGKKESYTYWLECSTENNRAAGPGAIVTLSEKVTHLLAKKKWKRRRYFGRSGALRDETASLGTATVTTDKSSETALSGVSEQRTTEKEGMTESEHGSLGRENEDHYQENMDHQDSYDMLNFMVEQKRHLGCDDWSKLRWEDGVPLEELRSRVNEILSLVLSECVHGDYVKMEMIKDQLSRFVERISALYSEENQFHNFRRVSHVILSAHYLWDRVRINDELPTLGHDQDPWDRFIIVFAALIHDAKHDGVSNSQLKAEEHFAYQMHGERGSCQERQSLHCSLNILEDEFPLLYNEVIFGCPKFLRLIPTLVLATDFEDLEMMRKRANNLQSILTNPCISDRAKLERNQAAMELVLAMADIGHYAQDFDIFWVSNQASFQECLDAHCSRRGPDPRKIWYTQQLEFFENAVLPLISQVQLVLPQSSRDLAVGAERNMRLWQERGRDLMKTNKLRSASIEDLLGKTEGSNGLEGLVNLNVAILEQLLKDVVAGDKQEKSFGRADEGNVKNSVDEIKMVTAIRQVDPDVMERASDVDFELSEDVRSELNDYVAKIAAGYKVNDFHNFEHASHVTMLSDLLLGRIEGTEGRGFGITSDPLARFAVVFSALVHDVGHTGVPNGQLAKESPELAALYKHKSIAEQNSVDTAWDLLMQDRYRNLRDSLCSSSGVQERLRKLIINCVMATDIFDPDLKEFRSSRWEKAILEATVNHQADEVDIAAHYKATIEIELELVMQASDVGHTMQRWHVYRKWNERLFLEMHAAYKGGRSDKNPVDGFYKGELWFFDNWVIPLASKLMEYGVMGIASDECLNQARQNREKWEIEGEGLCKLMLEKAEKKQKVKAINMASPAPRLQNVASRRAPNILLTSQIVQEVESISKVVKRYEKKMEAACRSLIAVAYKGKEYGIEDLKKKPVANIHKHFRKQDWYKLYSDEEWSGGGDMHEEEHEKATASQENKALIVLADSSEGPPSSSHANLAENATFQLSAAGKKYLNVDGSMHGQLGRVLTSLSTADSLGSVKETWSNIARLTNDTQSKDISDKLDDLLEYSVKAGFLVAETTTELTPLSGPWPEAPVESTH
jgi:class 3 adenylate cyclase